MRWIADRLLLLVTGLVCAGASWLVISVSGQWFSVLMLVFSYAALFAENSRLRKLLEKNGISSRRERPRQ